MVTYLYLRKLPSNAVNIFPVRDNGVYISSIFGGYNVNDDNSIWLYIKQDAGILQNSSIQISIYQNLTVAITSGMNYLIPVNDGIDVFTNLTSGPSGSNTKQLTIHTTGDGTKSLMDDGTYKEIGSSGVDISSYILEGIDFKKNTTKEGFDKIKSCVINKQHMYLYFYNAVGGDEASFYADVIAGVLYGNLNLCVYDFGSSKIVNIDINLQDYSITVNTQ